MSINWIDYNGYDCLLSTDVKVYPSAYRGTNNDNTQLDPKAVLNLEENIIKAANAGFPGVKSSENSYIISWTGGELKCVIAGYYFEIKNFTKADLGSYQDHRYAIIKLTNVTITEETATKILSPITGPGNTSTNEDPGATMILDDQTTGAFIGLAFTSSIETGFEGLDLLAPESNYKLSYTDILSNLKNNADGTISSITGNIVDGTGTLSTASLYEDSNNKIIKNNASGKYSHAEGKETEATETGAHAEGYGTHATGNYSHTEGSNTTASENYSHAEGSGTTASGTCSHAEGSSTTASGSYSHAEGSSTAASGVCSHAEGSSTAASGVCSHAAGHGTNALADYSLAIGRYNIGKPDTLFEIGYGTDTSSSQRKNIFEVAATGRIELGDSSYLTFGNNQHVYPFTDLNVGKIGTYADDDDHTCLRLIGREASNTAYALDIGQLGVTIDNIITRLEGEWTSTNILIINKNGISTPLTITTNGKEVATKEYVDNSIATSITNVLNTPV